MAPLTIGDKLIESTKNPGTGDKESAQFDPAFQILRQNKIHDC
jgi:hypothetical protein